MNLNSPKLISISSLCNDINIRDIDLNERIGKLHGHKSYIECIEKIDNNKFATGSFDNTVKIWDAKEKSCLRTLKGHKYGIDYLKSLSHSTLASGGLDELKIWNIDSGQCIQTIEECKYFCDIVFLPNGNLVSCHRDKTIRIRDSTRHTYLNTFTLDSVTNCLLLLANGHLACGCDDNNIRLLNIDIGLVINNLHGHSSSVFRMQSLPNGDLASCSGDNTIKIWNVKNGRCIRTLVGHLDKIKSLQVCRNGSLISCSEDGTIKECDLNSGEYIKTIDASIKDFILL